MNETPRPKQLESFRCEREARSIAIERAYVHDVYEQVRQNNPIQQNDQLFKEPPKLSFSFSVLVILILPILVGRLSGNAEPCRQTNLNDGPSVFQVPPSRTISTHLKEKWDAAYDYLK